MNRYPAIKAAKKDADQTDCADAQADMRLSLTQLTLSRVLHGMKIGDTSCITMRIF